MRIPTRARLVGNHPAVRRRRRLGSRKRADGIPHVGDVDTAFSPLWGTHMKGSTSSWAVSAIILLSIVAQHQLLRANPLWPPTGSYELTARLELPHLERWGVDKSTIYLSVQLPGS